MANIFKKGDVVSLKSGGPLMTIDGIPGEKVPGKLDNEYLCRWFRRQTPESGSYGEHLLKEDFVKIDPSGKAGFSNNR